MTAYPRIQRFEILGQNDEHIIAYGEGMGNRAIWAAEDQVQGIYDSPEKQTWKSGARTKGAKQKSRKTPHRDMEIGFHVGASKSHSYEQNESFLVQALGFALDPYDDDAKLARLAITTDMSSTRYLDIVQYEEPDIITKQDPIKRQYVNFVAKLRAGQPDWYEPPIISPCVFTEEGWGEVEVSNPTNRPMLHSWITTLGKFTLPDFSWKGRKGDRRPGGRDEAKFITTPDITPSHGGLTVNLPGSGKLMARSGNGTNILPLFGGRFFLHEIPPYTQKQTLPVRAENVPEGGAMVQLVQPRLWSRPWGLELIS